MSISTLARRAAAYAERHPELCVPDAGDLLADAAATDEHTARQAAADAAARARGDFVPTSVQRWDATCAQHALLAAGVFAEVVHVREGVYRHQPRGGFPFDVVAAAEALTALGHEPRVVEGVLWSRKPVTGVRITLAGGHFDIVSEPPF